MADFDVKIETFTNLTLTQAAKARDKILEKCENDKKCALEEYTKECGEKFSKLIKENQNKIKTENHQRVSKEVTECKRAVFSHREMLINRLFDELADKISEYKKTDKYAEYLKKCIDDGAKKAGGKDIILTFDASDKKIGNSLCERYGFSAQFKDNLCGGVIVSASGSNIAYNMSFSAQIENLRETFLENSGFSIDVM